MAHFCLVEAERRPTSCTFCRSATMFVRSFCSFSSASLSLSSLLLLFSSTALARASALLWYELHNDWRPDSYCWKYSFYKEKDKDEEEVINVMNTRLENKEKVKTLLKV